MRASEVLDDLLRQNIQVWTEGESLRVRAPRGALTHELRDRLAAHKADVLELLRKSDHTDPGSVFPQIIPDPERRYDPFPLTDIQQAYWIGRSGAIELGNVGCHAYYEVEASHIDLSRLSLAFHRLIERHDMLRAIVLADGRQKVIAHVPRYEIEILDLRRHDPQEAVTRLDAIRQRMSHQVLPSDRWPLFEIRASQLDDVRLRLHFSFDIFIADVHSLQILFREWAELYRDLNAQLPPLEIQFRDYVLAEIGHRDSKLNRVSQQYWAACLATLPAAPDLPLATSPSSVTKPKFVRRSGRLEPEIWARIKERAGEIGLTPSGALLAAFAEVLATWSKSPEFTINVTLFNRLPLHPQVNEIIGDFTTLVPLAVAHSSGDSFAARAGRIHAQLLKDIDHRLVSGVQILRDLARAQGRTPGATLPIVFTSLLSQRLTGNRVDKTLWMGEVVHGISQTPQVWLDHQVLEENGALVFNWDAVERLFPEGMLQDMFDTYCSLLQRLSLDQSAWRGSASDLLPPAQRCQRAAINQTETAIPPVMLHTLFQEQAKRRPQQQAVIAANGALTYEQLQQWANHLGGKLRQMGARPNRLVAVVMEKGWEQVAALMGVLQSGAAYLPIDPSLPKERLWHLLEHGQVSIALTQSWIDERLQWPAAIRRLAVDVEQPGAFDTEAIASVQQPDDLAYVIYTSGSTGLPKGVMINHDGAVNTILDINRRFEIGPDDRVLALSNLGFDLSVYDMFGTLAAGGTIILPDARATRDPAHWAELMQCQQVTIWNSAPALMEMLVAYTASRREPYAASLRLVLLSGDWIAVTLPDAIKELAGKAQVVSLGGATEASIWSILYPVGDSTTHLPSLPYGRPMANQRFHVLNQALEPRPIWVPGELYIGGLGLALGYWRDETRTKASFITHPRTGERLYRTGDLGRYLPDGNIEFLGREDAQVKVQGYRIELGEIEAVLGKYPGIRSKAIVAEGQREHKRLVAYLTVDPCAAPTADDLKRFLKQKLPAYMIPSSIVIADSLPLTTNGKIDRRALPELVQPTSLPPGQHVGGSASLEAQIAECVARVLKLDVVGPETDLLELGANSIDITRIATLLEKEFKVRPNFEDFYINPTPRSLARSFHEMILRGWEAEDVSLHAFCRATSRAVLGCQEGEL
jgi:pyochelin synthetase